MLYNIQKFLSRWFHGRIPYFIVYVSYGVIITTPILVYGYLTKTLVFVVYTTVSINILKKYTDGYHASSNLKCTYLTYCLIIIFSYLSKTIPIEWSFLICLYCMKDIYVKSVDKIKQITTLLGVSLGIMSIGLIINYETIIQGVIWSIVMVDVTLFKNKEGKES
jgi:accessory gene regulator protein AgrB